VTHQPSRASTAPCETKGVSEHMCQHLTTRSCPTRHNQSARPTCTRNTSLTICVTHQPSRASTMPPERKGACAQVCQHFDNALTPNPPQSKRTSKTRVKHITYKLRDAPSHPERPVPKRKMVPKRKECVQKCVSMFRQRANAQPATNIAHVQHTRARYITYHLRDAPAVKRPW
jgi:hypothetical protein